TTIDNDNKKLSVSASDSFLGLDIGGTGVKAGVFDTAGRQLGFARRGYQPISPEEGWAEIPIAEIYQATRQAVREAVGLAGCQPRAISISSQGQTFVALDDHDQPLYPAILWYDRRGCDYTGPLENTFAECQAGIPQVAPFATVTKIQWLKDHHPDLSARVRRYLLLPDYFAYRLTGNAVVDCNTAGSTGLCSRLAADFSLPALAGCGIRREQMSCVAPPGIGVGAINPEVAREWGLSAETLFVVGTNDQYAGALGAGNCRPGIVSVAFGSCLALLTLSEKSVPEFPGIFSGSFPVTAYRYVLAFLKASGLLLDWYRREMAGGMSFDQLNQLAAGVPPGSHGLTVVPHFDGRISPRPDAAMRGAIMHLTLQHTSVDVYRGILEALAFGLRENLEYLETAGYAAATVRAIGGGARNDLWMQMQADVAGKLIERPVVTEAAVLGAAMLAMAGADARSSLAAISARLYQPAKVFHPDLQLARAYQAAYHRYQAVCPPPTDGISV
ncbi:MAG: hypothetical protein LC725_11830, partial [Lentisphaerae bacterium]|nr:hypothetical protein [Lentisphaerota bacterium]